MPLNREPLPLEPDPKSVKRAREWVGDVLERLGRDDLVDAAELGVSELVTNAILHADPPITVRVRGTRNHPRVEVRERTNVRDLTPGDLERPADVLVADLSFISLRTVLPVVLPLGGPEAHVVLLVKPQF